MFDHKHYVPVLKGKDAEYGALRELSAEAKSHLTPLIEIPPIPYDFENDRPAKSIDAHLEKVVEKVLGCWMFKRPLFMDFLYIPPSELMKGDEQPLTYLLNNARLKQLRIIPVTGINRDGSYQAAVREGAAKDKQGVCIRLSNDDFEELLESDDKLNELLNFLGVTPNQTDIILDFREITSTQTSSIILAATSIISTLPSIKEWRTLTIASSAFPQTLSQINTASVGPVARAEWSVWEALAGRRRKLPRLPTFGDYSINNPDPSDVDPRLMIMSANLRYAIEREWLVFKGRSVKLHGFEQFNDLCSQVVAHTEYRGPKFSWGDKQISECSKRADQPGNPMIWRKIGFNHHLTLVTQQLANYPGL